MFYSPFSSKEDPHGSPQLDLHVQARVVFSFLSYQLKFMNQWHSLFFKRCFIQLVPSLTIIFLFHCLYQVKHVIEGKEDVMKGFAPQQDDGSVEQ
jgi:hypothetical protein